MFAESETFAKFNPQLNLTIIIQQLASLTPPNHMVLTRSTKYVFELQYIE